MFVNVLMVVADDDDDDDDDDDKQQTYYLDWFEAIKKNPSCRCLGYIGDGNPTQLMYMVIFQKPWNFRIP